MNRPLACCLMLVVSACCGVNPTVVATEPLKKPLWMGTPPGSEGYAKQEEYTNRGSRERPNGWLHSVSKPEVTVYRPGPESADCAAVVIFPGGAYSGQAIDKEGHFIARWMRERGLLAAVVPYRCGGGQHRHPVPMSDAQRAVQLVRSNADEWGVDRTKIGVVGFSAGGHLAATAATQWLEAESDAVDPLRRYSSRPDFAVLVYPVISMRDSVTHGGSRHNLLGENAAEEQLAALSADERVTGQTPPTLLIHSVDDRSVRVENAQRFYNACREAEVPVEMHLYETGGHGYGMWSTEGSIAAWPGVLEGWLKGRGLMD